MIDRAQRSDHIDLGAMNDEERKAFLQNAKFEAEWVGASSVAAWLSEEYGVSMDEVIEQG